MLASIVLVHIPLVPSMPAVSHTIRTPTVTGPLFWILVTLIIFLFLTTTLILSLYLVLRRRHHRLRHHPPTIPLSTIRPTPAPAQFPPHDHTPASRTSSTPAPPSHPAHKISHSPATITSTTTLWPRPTPTTSPLHHAIHPPRSVPSPHHHPIRPLPPPPPQPSSSPLPPPPRSAARPLTRSELHARHAHLAALARIAPDSHTRPVVFSEANTTDTSELDVQRRGPAVNAAYARWLEMRGGGGEVGGSEDSGVL